MNKLVSVLIPTYGGGQYLRRTIDSVLAQTYSHFEVIVIDDNGVGTENQKKTQAVMDAYKDESRVMYLCHEVNRNGSAARNTGFAHSKGDYICLLDDDDEYYPEKVERQVSDISSIDNSYALVYCRREAFLNGKSLGLGKETRSGYLFYDIMMHNVVIGSSSLMVRRNVWQEFGGFDESFRRHQDYEFTARIASKYKVYGEDFVGFNRYKLGRNVPQNIETAFRFRKHYIERMMPYIEKLPKRKQKDIIYSNYMTVCFMHLKEKDVYGFLRMYHSIRPGFYGIKYIIKHLFVGIKSKLK